VFCFQCGRPYYEDSCRTCGARIGGQNHTLMAGNAQIAELVNISLSGGLYFREVSFAKRQIFHYVSLLTTWNSG